LRDERPTFLVVLTNTALVTAAQLLLGAFLGQSLLHLHSVAFETTQKTAIPTLSLLQPDQVLLASLHMIGSIATNLGFMFGSASLVQIIKLMEPFQTLILSKLFSEEGRQITLGVVMSMSVTVGAAISLIKSRPEQPPLLSVLFAVLSGLTLSSRNVLQRRLYETTGPPSTAVSPRSLLTVARNQSETSPLERALVQFTFISLQSGVLVLCTMLIPLVCISPGGSILFAQETALRTYGDVLVWHPLYNAFSLITLAYCSALTHALLNAGKRVVAIAMAFLWFKEGFTGRNVIGLSVTLLGGSWYAYERQSKRTTKAPWAKVAVSLLILQLLFSSRWGTFLEF
jgi:hypothetical protein